jgi:hypothetical protein
VIIGLVGDLEGDRDWAVRVLRSLGRQVDVAIQLGDLRFGMGPDPDGYLAAIESVCAEVDLRLLGIGGNHEHWARLDDLWADPAHRDTHDRRLPLDVSDHVSLLPRGHRFELDGRSFVALGGAPSVNRLLLTEGVSWWPGEVITDEHVDLALDGGPADVMLLHDSPAPPLCTPPVAEIVRGNPMDWPEVILAEADAGMAQVTRAVLGVRPRLVAHGHFHVAAEAVVRLPGADHDTTIWSLAANGDPANVRLLDLATLGDPA